MTDRILILDFGSQVTQLIARRLREANVYCEIMPFDKGDDAVRAFAPNGIVLSGGPSSVTDAGTPRAPQRLDGARAPLRALQAAGLTAAGCGAQPARPPTAGGASASCFLVLLPCSCAS